MTSTLFSCVKEEGEPLIVTRGVSDTTMVTNEGGYLYGDCFKDIKLKDGYDVNPLKGNSAQSLMQSLSCWVNMKAHVTNIDLSKNSKITACGFVASQSENPAFENKESDQTFRFTEYDPEKFAFSDQEEFEFTVKLINLEYGKTYYVRSYYVTEAGDTAYNKTSLKYNSKTPSDVWFQRKQHVELSARSYAITFEDQGKQYIYGGRVNGAECANDLWVYDISSDTWSQLASAETVQSSLIPKRANGSAVVVPKKKLSDNGQWVPYSDEHIVFFVGGENDNYDATAQIFTYSIKNNWYNQQSDHPTGRDHVQPLPEPLKGTVAFTLSDDISEPYVYVGLGLNDKGAVNSSFYFYDAQFDKADAGNLAQKLDLNEIFRTATEATIARKPSNWNDEEGPWEGSELYSDWFMDEYSKAYSQAYNKLSEESGSPTDLMQYLTWNSCGNMTEKRKGEGLYQAVSIKKNNSSIYIGTGFGSNNKCTKDFYEIGFKSNGVGHIEIKENGKLKGPEEMEGRQAACGFMFSYEDEEGDIQTMLYIGTGLSRSKNGKGAPEKADKYFNDFWGYDSGNKEWKQCDNVGEKFRAGAACFVVERPDEAITRSTKHGYLIGGEVCTEQRPNSSDDVKNSNDSWEYLP